MTPQTSRYVRATFSCPSDTAIPQMPRLVVVFDSNAYRERSWAALRDITTGEQRHSVIANASYFVITELLAHLADPSDPAHGQCWAGLRKLWNHCKQYDGSRDVLRLAADSEAQVPHMLSGVAPPGRDAQAEAFGALVGGLLNAGTASWPSAQLTLRTLRQHVDDIEAAFVADLFDNVVRSLNPAATAWSQVQRSPMQGPLLARIERGEGRPLIGRMFALKAAVEVGRLLTIHELEAYGCVVRDRCPTAVAFYDTLVLRIVRDGLNTSCYPRPNSVWDLQVAFSIGKGARIGVAPVWLVTDDQAICAAALASGARPNVRTFDDYLSLLQLPTQQFNEVVDTST